MTLESDEQKRLFELYGGMQDEELLELADEISELSNTAQDALRAEQTRRNLGMPTSDEDVEEQEFRPLVTVRQFRDLPSADVAKSVLQSAGIEAFLQDDNIVRMDWFYSNLLGGIKLRVSPENAEAADEVLAQSIPSTFEVQGVGDFAQPRCPKCNSLEVTFTGLNKPVAYTTMWVLAPVPLSSNLWKCESCNSEWMEEPESPEVDEGSEESR